MFVLTISRSSSNLGYVGSKTRSPGHILGNSCLHPRVWRGITANKVKMCDDISNFSDDICNLYYDTYILTDENYNLHDC